MGITYFVYFFILISGTMSAFCVEKSKSKNVEVIWRFVLFIILLLPAVIRYDIGADYSEYKRIYDSDLYWSYAEVGFCLICDFLKFCGCSSFGMFFVIAFITYFFICFLVKKEYFGIFIFFYIAFYGYFNTYDQIRQALALPFIIFSIYSLVEKKYLKMILLIFIASTFHKSSLVFLLFLPISLIKFDRFTYLFISLCLIFLSISVDYVNLIKKIADLSNFRYLILLTNSIGVTASLGMGLLLKIVYPIMFILTVPRCKNKLKTAEAVSSNFCVMYVVLSFLVLRVDIFNRLRDVIWIGLLYSTTVIPASRYRKLIFYFLLFSGIVLYWVVIQNSVLPGTKQISPYHTIFD